MPRLQDLDLEGGRRRLLSRADLLPARRVTTRKGAFGILFENGNVTAHDRSTILEASVDHGNVLFVTTSDFVQRGYVLKNQGALTNQQAFLMNAGRLLATT